MPNIDTSTIEGFQDMTAEQKVEALLKAEIPEAVDLSQYVAKKTFDEKASEAAELSKKLKGKMSEDEAAKAQAARFLALGYEEKLARETAEALYDGNMEKVFENQQKANEAAEKKLRAELVKMDPKPAGAGGDGGEKDDAVEFAKSLGKQRAEAMKQSAEGLKRYF